MIYRFPLSALKPVAPVSAKITGLRIPAAIVITGAVLAGFILISHVAFIRILPAAQIVPRLDNCLNHAHGTKGTRRENVVGPVRSAAGCLCPVKIVPLTPIFLADRHGPEKKRQHFFFRVLKAAARAARLRSPQSNPAVHPALNRSEKTTRPSQNNRTRQPAGQISPV